MVREADRVVGLEWERAEGVQAMAEAVVERLCTDRVAANRSGYAFWQARSNRRRVVVCTF